MANKARKSRKTLKPVELQFISRTYGVDRVGIAHVLVGHSHRLDGEPGPVPILLCGASSRGMCWTPVKEIGLPICQNCARTVNTNYPGRITVEEIKKR